MERKELTVQQVEACHLLLTRKANGMTIEQVAQAVGCDRRTLTRWRNLPLWRSYEAEQAMIYARSHLSDVMDVLVEKALTGHPKSMELYLRSVHILGNDAKPVAVNEPEIDPRSNEILERELVELHRLLAEVKEPATSHQHDQDDDDDEEF